MTDLAQYQPREITVPAADPTGGRLAAWAESLRAAHTIGQALCSTAFAPAHFRGKPEDAAAAILYGDEIGLTPTAALRSIFVISGAPGLYARSMHALVLSRGHEVWTEEESPAKVTVCGRRRGSSHVEKSTWTIDRARIAGYTNNAQYAKNPANMLYARALGDVCRKVAPDVLSGISYTVEELQLEQDEPSSTVTRLAPAATRKVSRTRRAAPEPPPLEPTEENAPEAAVEWASKGQVDRLRLGLERSGLKDRDARLDWISTRAGRPVDSSTSLTKTEAARLIDLAERTEEPPLEEPPGWAS